MRGFIAISLLVANVAAFTAMPGMTMIGLRAKTTTSCPLHVRHYATTTSRRSVLNALWMDSERVSTLLSPPITFKPCGFESDDVVIDPSDSLDMGFAVPSVTTLKHPSDGSISIFNAVENVPGASLKDVGEAARDIIDLCLSDTGAVILRGMPISSAADFSQMWRACLNAPDRKSLWKNTEYLLPVGGNRPREDGVDMATNVAPSKLVSGHNEMYYNPQPASRIGLFCLHPAKNGGETIITKNEDLTKAASEELLDFLRDHEGIRFDVTLSSATQTIEGPYGSYTKQGWRERCGLTEDQGREDAQRFMMETFGYESSCFEWDENETMRIKFRRPGMVKDWVTGKDILFGGCENGNWLAGDGSNFPQSALDGIQADRWKYTYGFKLLEGDWLVLDNMRWMHGRLPFVQNQEGSPKRTIFTTYTSDSLQEENVARFASTARRRRSARSVQIYVSTACRRSYDNRAIMCPHGKEKALCMELHCAGGMMGDRVFQLEASMLEHLRGVVVFALA